MNEGILDEGLIEGPVGNNIIYASFWTRVGASLIDFLVLLPLIGLMMYNNMAVKSMWIMIGLYVLMAAYKPLLEWDKGATLGKMAVKIKVVDADSLEKMTLNQSIKRYLPWLISNVISLILAIMLFNAPGFEEATNFIELGLLQQEQGQSQGEMEILNWVNGGYSLIFMAVVLSVAFDSKKQGLHDKMASTYVVKS